MQEVLVNRLGGLSLPRKSVARLTDHPDMTIPVYIGSKTTSYNTTTIPWRIGIPPCSSPIYMKGNNFCDFLVSSLDDGVLPK